jgi:hypothetical protein
MRYTDRHGDAIFIENDRLFFQNRGGPPLDVRTLERSDNSFIDADGWLIECADESERDRVFARFARKLALDRPAPADLKPRGVKRQWWLVPLDALALALGHMEAHGPHGRGTVGALGDYQARPSVDTAAAVAAEWFRRVAGADPSAGLDLVVQVFEHGAAKYTPENWRGAASDLDAFRREYISAQCRHLFATNGPIDLDHTLPDGTEIKGSGLPHSAHGMCTALMVLWHEMRVAA